MSANVDETGRFSQDAPEPARRLWKLWQQETPPDLARFVAEMGECKPAMLAAVLCVDLRERWRRHERIPVEEYFAKFPQVKAERESALDVVYCEYLLRDEMGKTPDAAEYQERFPDLAAELRKQIEMHRLLEENLDDDIAENSNAPTMVKEPRPDKATISDLRPTAVDPGSWPKLPGYEILGRLGRGGMGIVYKAWQDRLYRIVAIKMLQAGVSDAPQALARFQTEGEAIARLQHPNILQIFEVGEYDGAPFLVMEFADAGSLAQKLNGTPWPPRDAAVLMEKLARAVHYAHQKGVLHRDLTPGNVVLFTDGTPKLSDFGLAKLLVGGTPVTETGAVVGTPSYMSPEQASGKVHAIGPAVDVYALGAILFELLTGRPPFKAATPLETLAQVVHTDPVPPRQLQPAVPRDLETICLKSLRKEPVRRYASAAELADDLGRFLKDVPILARPVGPLERVWRWGWRNPGWAAALVLVLFTAVAAVIASQVLAVALGNSERDHEKTKKAQARLREQTDRATNALAESREAHAKTKAAEIDLQRQLYRSHIGEAKTERLSNRPGQRLGSLALLDKARTLADTLQLGPGEKHELRNEIVACLALPDLKTEREWNGLPAGSFSVDFDEGLKCYARSDTQGKITIRRIADDAELAAIPGSGELVLLRFSPDAKLLAVLMAGTLRLWRVGAESPLLEKAIGPGELSAGRFAFGADGVQLAVIDGDGMSIRVFDVTTGADALNVRLGFKVRKLAFHPTRPLLALARDKDLILYDLTNRNVTHTLPQADNVCALAWSRDGRVLASGCDDKFVSLWDVSSPPRLMNRYSAHSAQGLEISLNAAGTVLGTTNSYGSLRLWNTHGGQQLVTPLAEGGQHRFAAQGDLLACGAPGGKIRLHKIILGSEFRRLPAFARYRQAGPRLVVFHPSGRFLLASSEQGLTILDPRSVEMSPMPRASWMIPVAFEPRGCLITASAKGFETWPPLPVEARLKTSVLRYGPATLHTGGVNGLRTAVSVDGRFLAVPEFDKGTRLVWLDSPGKETKLGPQKDVRSAAISPDGRWVATGTFSDPGQPGAVIWDAQTGKRVHDIPALPRFCEVDFSPDGRWLITSGGGCQLWKVGSWEPGPNLHGAAFAFAPDGKMLAVEGDEGQVRLIDPDTGREHVILTAPGEMHSLPSCFSPDGSLLVVFGTESQALHTWDLRAVRAHLQKQGLDWELPPYTPDGPEGPMRLDLVDRPE